MDGADSLRAASLTEEARFSEVRCLHAEVSFLGPLERAVPRQVRRSLQLVPGLRGPDPLPGVVEAPLRPGSFPVVSAHPRASVRGAPTFRAYFRGPCHGARGVGSPCSALARLDAARLRPGSPSGGDAPEPLVYRLKLGYGLHRRCRPSSVEGRVPLTLRPAGTPLRSPCRRRSSRPQRELAEAAGLFPADRPSWRLPAPLRSP